jgi:endonuclease/exonuclease/phosphatase family metal-dependent hydrolase
MLDSWVLAMQEDWTHNKPRDPRVYTAVKCQLVSNPWVQFDCIDVHFPTDRTGNGPARQESVDRMIAASTAMPDLPLIICGDFNMGAAEARQRIADAIGGHLYSAGSVDHIILRDGKDVGFDDVSVAQLGLLGSDHQAVRSNFSFIQLSASGVPDWSLF